MPRRSSKRSSQKSSSSLANEVQRLFKSGATVDTDLLLSLRHRYGDDNVANRVMEAFVERHNNVIILEINRDAQLYGIMRKEYPNHLLNKMHSVAYSDGMPPRARLYAERIMEVLKEVGA